MNGIILTLLVFGAASGPAEFQAGVARKVITPTGPIWMSGYAARTRPSEGVAPRSLGQGPGAAKTPRAGAW